MVGRGSPVLVWVIISITNVAYRFCRYIPYTWTVFCDVIGQFKVTPASITVRVTDNSAAELMLHPNITFRTKRSLYTVYIGTSQNTIQPYNNDN